MTIDEAIKQLNEYQHDHYSYPLSLQGQAMRLGIEALKLVKSQRGHRWVDAPKPLPGETVPSPKEAYAESAGLPAPEPGETEKQPRSLTDPDIHLGKREGDK